MVVIWNSGSRGKRDASFNGKESKGTNLELLVAPSSITGAPSKVANHRGSYQQYLVGPFFGLGALPVLISTYLGCDQLRGCNHLSGCDQLRD